MQVADALRYLHGLNIMHRDIKPENILVLDAFDPNTGQPRVKLLDFGLSKSAANGSTGRSFVGTPCYLAPEVELTSKGQGVYGLAADCWSLGALLHVMLVARFPEFERDRKRETLSLVLPAKHWGAISDYAKDLVRRLMEPNSFARLTVKEVMMHPWLGIYQSSGNEVPKPPPPSPGLSPAPLPPAMSPISSESHGVPSAASVHDFQQLSSLNDVDVMSLQEEFDEDAGYRGRDAHAIVVKASPRSAPPSNKAPHETADSSLQLGPLLNLQRSIALCFEDALASYVDYPEVATQIHKGAVMCRKQLMDSTKMLRKVEQTASSVLDLFPDLELAVEEGAPQLAAEFFSVVRNWVVELRETVTQTQRANHESMLQIHAIIHESTSGLSKGSSRSNLEESSKPVLDAASVLEHIQTMQALAERNGGLTSDQIFELFMGLFNAAVSDKAEDSPDKAAAVSDGDLMERDEDHERNDSVAESIYTPAALNDQRTDSLSDSVETGNELERRSTAGKCIIFPYFGLLTILSQILSNRCTNRRRTIS